MKKAIFLLFVSAVALCLVSCNGEAYSSMFGKTIRLEADERVYGPSTAKSSHIGYYSVVINGNTWADAVGSTVQIGNKSGVEISLDGSGRVMIDGNRIRYEGSQVMSSDLIVEGGTYSIADM